MLEGGQSARQRDEVMRTVVGACMRRSFAHPSVVISDSSSCRVGEVVSRGAVGFVIHRRVPTYRRKLVRKAPIAILPPVLLQLQSPLVLRAERCFARPSRSQPRVNYDVNEATGVAERQSLTVSSHPSPSL